MIQCMLKRCCVLTGQNSSLLNVSRKLYLFHLARLNGLTLGYWFQGHVKVIRPHSHKNLVFEAVCQTPLSTRILQEMFFWYSHDLRIKMYRSNHLAKKVKYFCTTTLAKTTKACGLFDPEGLVYDEYSIHSNMSNLSLQVKVDPYCTVM